MKTQKFSRSIQFISSLLFLVTIPLYALGGDPPPCTPSTTRQYLVAPNLSGGDIQASGVSIVNQNYPYPYSRPITNVFSFLTSIGIQVTNGSDYDSVVTTYQDQDCNLYIISSTLVVDNVTTIFPYNFNPTTNNILWSTSPGGQQSMAYGKVYYGDSNGVVNARDLLTGEIIWTFQANDRIDWGICVANGIVFVPSIDGAIYGLNAMTGELLWNYQTGVYNYNAAISRNSLYITVDGGKMYAFSSDTGADIQNWPMYRYDAARSNFNPDSNITSHLTTKWIANLGTNALGLSISSGKLYMNAEDGNMYVIDASNGNVLWNYQTGDSVSASVPAVDNGAVYFGSMDGYFYSLDANTAVVRWTHYTDDWNRPAPAVAYGGHLYIGSWDGNIYSLDTGTGDTIWSYNADVAESASAIADGVVYQGGNDGVQYALDAGNGNLLWSQTLGGSVSCAVANGVVYAYQGDTLYALSKATINTFGNYTISARWDDTPLYANDSAVTKSFVLQLWSITSVHVDIFSNTSTKISWYTNIPTSSQISYGLSTCYGKSTPADTTLVYSHSQILTDLTTGSPYHLSITSQDSKGHTLTTGDFALVIVCTPGYLRDQYVATPDLVGGDILSNGTSIVNQIYPYPYTQPITDVSSFLSSIGISATDGSDTDTLQHIYVDNNCNEYVQSSSFVTDSVTTYFPYSSPTTITTYGDYTITAQWDDDPLYGDDLPVTKSFILRLWNIDNINIDAITSDTTQIFWHTFASTSCQINYGVTTSFDKSNTEGAFKAMHNQNLDPINIDTAFYFTITAFDSWGHSLTTKTQTIINKFGFIDSQYGNDTNDGMTANTPWKTLSHSMSMIIANPINTTYQWFYRVAQGNYQEKNLALGTNLTLLGGFQHIIVPGGTDIWNRNPRRFETIINFDTSGSATNPSAVLYCSPSNFNIKVDGVTITLADTTQNNAYGVLVNTDDALHPGMNGGAFVVLSNNILRDLNGGKGIGIWSEVNTYIVNNVIRDSKGGIEVTFKSLNDLTTKPDVAFAIQNNTLMNNNNFGIYLGLGYNQASTYPTPDFGYKRKVLNNIVISTKGNGIVAISTSYDKIYNNDVWNNDTNYLGLVSTLDHTADINTNPLLTHNGNVESDGYYLAQASGDVSIFPFRQSDLTGITPHPSYSDISIIVYATESTTTGLELGHKTDGSNYVDGASHVGNILLCFAYTGGVHVFSVGDYVTLNFASGDSINVALPGPSFNHIYPDIIVDGHPNMLWFWVALDGSSYYAAQAGGYGGAPDFTAAQAMSDKTTNLAQGSYDTFLQKSPCIDAGDSTLNQFAGTNGSIVVGGTASNFNRDRSPMDIGFHYDWPFLQVSGNGRTFEWGDGTPYIPMGFSPKTPIWQYINSLTSLPQVDDYLGWSKAHGFNSIIYGFHDERPQPWNYPNDDTNWYSIEKPIGFFNDTVARWTDQMFDTLDKHQMTYYLGLWQTYPGGGAMWSSSSPRSKYNVWYNGSSIFYDSTSPFQGLSKPMEVLNTDAGFAIETNALKYYIDRWGDRGGLIFWDPIPEMNYIGDSSLSVDTDDIIKIEWITRIHDAIYTFETAKWGKAHMFNESAGQGNPTPVGYSTTACFVGGLPDNLSGMWGAMHGLQPQYPSNGTDTCQVTRIYFQHPKIDFVASHLIGITSTLQFPLSVQAIQGGPSSLWYDTTSSQWMVDSVAIECALSVHTAIRFAFSLMTSQKPFLCTLIGPVDYDRPWVPASIAGDTVSDNGYSSLTATATITVDRHIAENLHQAYNRYVAYANLFSGGAGQGYNYGIDIFNKFANPTANVDYLANNNTKYHNSINIEYNAYDDQMFNDQLAFSKIINSFNWSGIKQWENLNTTGRLTLTYDTASGVIPMYAGDSQNLMIWLMRDTRPYGSYTSLSTLTTNIHVTGFPSGKYQITWYESSTGNILGTSTTSTNVILVDAIAPTYIKDIVAIIKPN